MPELAEALRAHVHGTALEPRLALFGEPFLARRGGDASLREARREVLRGLARLLASHPDCGRYLAHRPELVERIARSSAAALAERLLLLETVPRPDCGGDLEIFLDALRLFRRDETCFAAALDFGGQVPFEQASRYLSQVAETCVRWALEEAAEQLRRPAPDEIAVVGMGKISGRELTYHSDLDLVFLYADDAAPDLHPAALAQRVIHYLSTMTGAGIAYPVDARLRPSGRQGALVSAFSAFETYQRDKAATWEHLALTRARVLAGDPRGISALQTTRRPVRGQHRSVWPQIDEMRERIIRERAPRSPDEVPYKTGRGGLMDAEFLAQGGVLECGSSAAAEQLPSIENLLRSTVAGAQVDALLAQYAALRRIEGRSRWVNGRATESFAPGGTAAECSAELVEPGGSLPQLLQRLDSARAGIRAAYERVIGAASIAALR